MTQRGRYKGFCGSLPVKLRSHVKLFRTPDLQLVWQVNGKQTSQRSKVHVGKETHTVTVSSCRGAGFCRSAVSDRIGDIMWAVLLGQGGEAVLPGDATCVLSIRQQQQHRCAAEPNRLVGKLNGVKGLVKLLSAAQRQHSPPEAVDKQRQHTPGAFGPKAGGFKSKGSNPASHSTPWRSGLRANTQKQV